MTVQMANVAPNELAEVDFGCLGLAIDAAVGHRRVVYALIVTLVVSWPHHVHVTHGLNLDAVVDGLEDAWEFFGAVPVRVVTDIRRPVVVEAER